MQLDATAIWKKAFDMAGSRHEADRAIPRSGYNPDFLGTPVGLPSLDPSIQDDALLWNGEAVVPYTHFSLSMSTSRRFAR